MRGQIISIFLIVQSIFATTAYSGCLESQRLSDAASALCKSSNQYCADAKLYKERVSSDCSIAGSSSSTKPTRKSKTVIYDVPPNSKMPIMKRTESGDNDDLIAVPPSCGYFSKPLVDDSGTHLNFHQPGAMICYSDIMYRCIEDNSGGPKQWIAQGLCITYKNQGTDLTPDKVEHSDLEAIKVLGD